MIHSPLDAVALALVVGFLGGIRLMNSPRTAVFGNLLGAACMFAAIVLTLTKHAVIGTGLLWGSMAVGAAIGALAALKAAMVQMPQMVALLNGLGGAASAIVALSVLQGGAGELNLTNRLSCGLALAVGTVTLSGSLLAAAKLTGWVRQRPVILTGHAALMALTFAAMLALALSASVTTDSWRMIALPAAAVAAAAYGLLMTLRIGGADMPVTISLLNASSGLAAAIAGFAMVNPLLVAVGGIVGAAGLLLTQAMCRAMNRSLIDVLSGRTTVLAPAPIGLPPTPPGVRSAEAESEPLPESPPSPAPARRGLADAAAILRAARRVIIVPGYGMALAQAQQGVRQLMESIESYGAEVAFAVHPVAGRMPGHMHVLLAEVDVPYDKLWGLDQANEAFPQTDVAIVVGANDVINPAAQTAEGTPIYGIPILIVAAAAQIIICNLDRRPGYAGVPNPLYDDPRVVLLEGDASKNLEQLTKLISA
jgi:NAD(P) transhydrogenase subunit beta